MKRCCTILCLWLGLVAIASAAVNLVVTGGVLRDANGATLTPGSLVAVVASTQDNLFGVPAASSILQAGATFGGDDVVLAVFPVGAQNTAVGGGFVGVINFNYAAMGVPNLGAGDQLKLYWFPASSLNGNQILPSATYGAYRTSALQSRSNTTWVAPDDSLGGTLELNFLTQAAGGDVADSQAIGNLTLSSGSNATVTVTASPAAEPATAGQFTFTRTGSTAGSLTVNFTVAGSATSGADYTPLGTTATFAAGAATTTLAVNVVDDGLVEAAENVLLTLGTGSGYTVGNPGSATVTIQDDDSPPTTTSSYVTGTILGTPRNDYSGWLGMQITVGASPLTLSQLGRMMAPGNTGTHTVKLVRASDGLDVPGGATTISMIGGSPGQFSYASLAAPVTLAAGTTYWIVSQETAGGDVWYEWTTGLTTTGVATDIGPVWGSGPGDWNPFSAGNRSFVPVDFKYNTSAPTTNGSFVTGTSFGPARNDYSGWVGMQIVVGASPLTVTQLGRIVAPGSTGTHTVKLVRASDGLDVPGGATAVATNGGIPGQFSYGNLSTPVTLSAGTTYWILSQETFGGDTWYDWNTNVTTTGVASDIGAVWGSGPGDWHPFSVNNCSFVPVDFKYSTGVTTTTASYITGTSLGPARNDYSGWVGMQIVVGASPLTVTQLGRMTAPGSSGTHTVKLVRASDGLDVPGGAASVAMSGGTSGQFSYGNLSSPVTLSPGVTYWVVSQEMAGGDTWYDWTTDLTTTSVAAEIGAVWGSGPGNWNPFNANNRGFVPVDLKYSTGAPTGGPTAYVTSTSLGPERNDYSGWVGMQFRVGAAPLTVTHLGRLMTAGNSGTHTVKFVQASNGLDVAGGAVSISMNGGAPGEFKYGMLNTPVTLAAGATYWIVSQEMAGGDIWHDWNTGIITTSAATQIGPVWGSGPGDWNPFSASNRSFVPVDFKY